MATKTEDQITIPVRGMTCASCVGRVEGSLSKVPGVTKAAVNLATEEATVAYEPDVCTVTDLYAAVEAAGYEAKPVTKTFAVRGMTCASCVKRVEDALLKVRLISRILEGSFELAEERLGGVGEEIAEVLRSHEKMSDELIYRLLGYGRHFPMPQMLDHVSVAALPFSELFIDAGLIWTAIEVPTDAHIARIGFVYIIAPPEKINVVLASLRARSEASQQKLGQMMLARTALTGLFLHGHSAGRPTFYRRRCRTIASG